jgi:FtsX-like permease family
MCCSSPRPCKGSTSAHRRCEPHQVDFGRVREQALQSIGDLNFAIRSVISAVLIGLVFSTAMMMQTIRERTPELAVLLMSAFGRSTYNDVNVMLDSPRAFSKLFTAIRTNPQLHVVARREADIQAASARQMDGILNFVAYFSGAILAIAATIGSVNSLYAVVDNRRRELATFRAVGFGGAPVVASTLSEAGILSIPGALLGAGLAWLFFDGRAASPFGFQFHLVFTAPFAFTGIIWALFMGMIGELAPAIRAARVPVIVNAGRRPALQGGDEGFLRQILGERRSRYCFPSFGRPHGAAHQERFWRSSSPRSRASWSRSSGVSSLPKSCGSNSGRTVTSTPPSKGARLSHSTASSIDLTCQIQ